MQTDTYLHSAARSTLRLHLLSTAGAAWLLLTATSVYAQTASALVLPDAPEGVTATA